MVEENYVEWLVKRKTPVYAVPAKIALAVVCMLSVLLALQTVLGVIIMTVAFVATYFLYQSFSVEYEYLFADGGLRVDRIFGKARRKKAFECNKEDVQFTAPADSDSLKDYECSGMKVMDFTSGKGADHVYALIYQKGAEHGKVLFQPNEKMLAAMKRTFPSKMGR